MSAADCAAPPLLPPPDLGAFQQLALESLRDEDDTTTENNHDNIDNDGSDEECPLTFPDPVDEETEVIMPFHEGRGSNIREIMSFPGDTFDAREARSFAEPFASRTFVDSLMQCFEDLKVPTDPATLGRKIDIDIARTPTFWQGQRVTDAMRFRRELAMRGFRNSRWWLLAGGGSTAYMMERVLGLFGSVTHVSRVEATWVRFDVLEDGMDADKRSKRPRIRFTASALFRVVDEIDPEVRIVPWYRAVQTFVLGRRVGWLVVAPEHGAAEKRFAPDGSVIVPTPICDDDDDPLQHPLQC
jgi:hypothetical protein